MTFHGLQISAFTGWLDAHAGTGSWLQGLFTFASVIVIAFVARAEGRRALRIHRESIVAQQLNETARRRAAQQGALNVADFAARRFGFASEHADKTPDLRGIDVVFAPDFLVLRESLGRISSTDVEDPGIIELIHLLMIDSITAARQLENMSRWAADENISESEIARRIEHARKILRELKRRSHETVIAEATRLGFERWIKPATPEESKPASSL